MAELERNINLEAFGQTFSANTLSLNNMVTLRDEKKKNGKKKQTNVFFLFLLYPKSNESSHGGEKGSTLAFMEGKYA